MKTIKIGLIALLAAGAMFSCQKEKTRVGGAAPTTLSKEDRALELASNMPIMRVVDEDRNRYIDVDFSNKTLAVKDATDRDFNFGAPNPGWTFSNSNGVTWVANPDGQGGILWVDASSFGGNSGGTVVAGNTTLSIDYSFCFAASSSALGMDLFSTGATMDGVSGVIGIDGDFDALINGAVDSTSSFTDYFNGFAAYFVYDNEAQGSYPILNWLEDLSNNDLANQGFSYVLGFQEGNFYLSDSGTLDVNGGSMTFSGTYFGLEGLFDSLFSDNGDVEFVSVSGAGSMGCN
jgi:hypothetical protein